MNREALRRIDLHLMVVFEAMTQELNVTKVADRLSLTQPTVSACLRRLRDKFDDPLFIKSGTHMEPTARAMELQQYLSPALDSLSLALSKTTEFSPERCQSTFRIGLSDDVEIGLLSSMAKAIGLEAPSVKLIIIPIDSHTVSEALVKAEITLAISPVTILPANAIRRTVKTVSFSILRGDDSPGPLRLEDFRSRPHVRVAPNSHISGILDEAYIQYGASCKSSITVPRFSSLPMLLSENKELLAIVPTYVASAITSLTAFRSEPLPIESPSAKLYQTWLQTHDKDPAERWLRQVVRASLLQ